MLGNLWKLQSFSHCLRSRITNIKMNTAWVYINSYCIFIVPFEYGDLLTGVLFSVVFVTLSRNLVMCDIRRNFILGRKSIHLCRNCCSVGRFEDVVFRYNTTLYVDFYSKRKFNMKIQKWCSVEYSNSHLDSEFYEIKQLLRIEI